MKPNNHSIHGKVFAGLATIVVTGLIPAAVLLSIFLLLVSLPLPDYLTAPFHPVIKVQAKKKTITLVLDPGHGGSQSGAEEGDVKEKDLNLTIGKYLKEILESDYEGIRVSLTRDEDEDVGLKERVRIASDRDADMMISLHNNARGDNFEYKDGCTVLTAQGNYKPDLARQEQELACCILSELEALGLNNRGILLRDSETGDSYEDGSVADYYAIIRGGLNLNTPSVIVEHAFMDEENDFQNHLSSDEHLKELAQADAAGIARYFGLKSRKTGEVLPPPADYEVIFYHMYDENPDHNKKFTKVFFPSEENKEKSSEKAAEQSTEEIKRNPSEESTESRPEESTAQHKDPGNLFMITEFLRKLAEEFSSLVR